MSPQHTRIEVFFISVAVSEATKKIRETGSPFVRSLVATFHKYACSMTLLDIAILVS